MIEVKVDMSRAGQREVEAFLALPGVSRALDAMTHATLIDGDVEVRLAVAPPQLVLSDGVVREDGA